MSHGPSSISRGVYISLPTDIRQFIPSLSFLHVFLNKLLLLRETTPSDRKMLVTYEGLLVKRAGRQAGRLGPSGRGCGDVLVCHKNKFPSAASTSNLHSDGINLN